MFAMKPQLVDSLTAPDSQLRLHHDFLNARRAEILPEDLPIPWEERRKWWREPAPHEVSRTFALYDNQKLIGIADSNWRTNDTENPDTAWVDVVIAPEAERLGHGSSLLLALLEEIAQYGRKKLFTATTSLRPSGKSFVQAIGAKFGQEEHTNQLLLSELNREYVIKSLKNAPTDLYELVWYEDNLPQDVQELQRICDVYSIMNTAPRGELEFNDFKDTPEKLLEDFANMAKRETKWILCLARDKATGVYAGFTQTGWHHNRPKIGLQWGTGVDPAHRSHGLGAWLKTAMLERLIEKHPTVDRIRTGNADSNAPMLKINHTLGFKPFMDRTEWQIDVAKTLEILRARVK